MAQRRIRGRGMEPTAPENGITGGIEVTTEMAMIKSAPHRRLIAVGVTTVTETARATDHLAMIAEVEAEAGVLTALGRPTTEGLRIVK